MFADAGETKIPLQEFRTICEVIQDPGKSHPLFPFRSKLSPLPKKQMRLRRQRMAPALVLSLNLALLSLALFRALLLAARSGSLYTAGIRLRRQVA